MTDAKKTKGSIIITGASDGLGLCIAKHAQRANYTPINISRRESIVATQSIIADLQIESEIDTAVQKIKHITDVRAIILNAGVLSLQPITQISGSELDRVLAVNLKAPMLMVSKLFEWIIENNIDVVIVNSTAGLRVYKGQPIYNVSKRALHGFTEDLRVELAASNSRVIGVYPDMLDTNMAAKLPGGPMPKSSHPTIDPEYVAALIIDALEQEGHMEVADIVINRKVVR